MSRKIVFINQATGYLTIDIVNTFAGEFDKVALIAGSIRVQDTQLNSKVSVSRIISYNRGSNIRKATSWLIGTLQIYLLLKFRYKDYEKFFFSIPPTAYLLALLFKSSYSIALYDLYPEALLIHRFSKKGVVFKWWSYKNRMIFQKAQKIYTLSEYMKARVLEYNGNSKVKVISNWSAFSLQKRIEKEQNDIISREGLRHRFIVQYSGNIGVSHNVEVLIDVAESLKDMDDLVFLIIGRGDRSSKMGELIHNKGLKNCRLLPFRKDEELYESLCAADLAVITLNDRTPDISVPSKTYNIMAAGTPMMAIASLKSEIAGIILRHQTGKVFEKNNIKGMCEFILELKNRPGYWNTLSANSLRASQEYTRENAARYLEFYND